MTTDTPAANQTWPDPQVSDPTYPPHVLAWQELCAAHPFLWMITCSCLRESRPPAPLPSEAFLALLGTLLCPHHRQILRELLKELLRDDMISIVEWYGGNKQ